MKSLIITVAGLSSRFNRDTKEEVLKCLYSEGGSNSSLLSQQIHKVNDLVDEIIIVGGFKYETLVAYIHQEFKDVASKIKCIYNRHYQEYGSGYSLLMGIEAVSNSSDEIIFIEGDLFFDKESVKSVIYSTNDAISIINEPILADKAVALYFDTNNYPHYIFDTHHSYLEISEPFIALFNSGQLWKFRNPSRVKNICQSLTEKQKKGTNLEIIQQYFGCIPGNRLSIIPIKTWFNCNTVTDYKEASAYFEYGR